MKLEASKIFSSSFHQKLFKGVEADYKDYLNQLKEELDGDLNSLVLTDDFLDQIKRILKDPTLQHYSHLRYYWTHIIEQITYVDDMHDEIGEDHYQGDVFSEIEEELFSFWQDTEYAELFLESLNEGKTLVEASKELASLLEHQILAFYYVHLKKEDLELPFTLVYQAIPELGDNESNLYITDKHHTIELNNEVAAFPHIPIKGVLGNKKAFEIESNEDILEAPIDKRSDSFKVKDHNLYILPQCEMGKANIATFQEKVSVALDCLRILSPSTYETFNSFTHTIVPVNEPGIVSYSMQPLPGYSCINLFERDFVDLMDDLIHENGHHYLNAFLNQDEILHEDDDKIYYSPWRRALRPVRGIYHAVFTFYWALKLFSDLYENCVSNNTKTLYSFSDNEKTKITKRFIEEYYMLTYCGIDLAHAFESGKVTHLGNEIILTIFELIEQEKDKLENAKKTLKELSIDASNEIDELVSHLKEQREHYKY